MRVLVAPDRFEEASAVRAARAIAEGWAAAAPGDDVRTAPVSDGGPGFLAALQAGVGGELAPVTVDGPGGAPLPAAVLLAPGGRTAYVEAAQAVGLDLVPPDRRDPAATSSVGAGQLLEAARATGAGRVVIGVGGLLAHDGGAGALAAMLAPRGARGVAGAGPLTGGGAALLAATAADLAGLADLRDGWRGVDLVVAADADLPLLGLHGASATDAEGKGASPEQAQQLERALGQFAALAEAAVGPGASRPSLLAAEQRRAHPERRASAAGSGAGGGLAFGLSLLGARIVGGAAVVADAVGLPGRLEDVDVVVTATALLDGAALHDGVVATVAAAALEVGVPTVVLARRSVAGRREWSAAGLSGAYALEDGPGAPRVSAADRALPPPPGAPDLPELRSLAERVARTWSR